MLSKLDQRTREIIALCLFAVALLVLLSLVTYNSSDPTLFTTSSGKRAVSNTVGIFGANLAALLLVAIGISAYWLPIFLIAAALRLFMTSLTLRPLMVLIGCTLLIIATSGLAALYWSALRLWGEPLPASGGILGLMLKRYIQYYLKPVGAYLLLWLLAIVAILLATPMSLTRTASVLNAGLKRLGQTLRNVREERNKRQKLQRRSLAKPPVLKTQKERKPEPPEHKQAQFQFMDMDGEFRLPDISLLDATEKSASGPDQESLLMNSRHGAFGYPSWKQTDFNLKSG